MILGVGLGIYSEYPETYLLYITYFIMICYLIDDISRDLLISCGLADSDSRKEGKNSMSIYKGSKLKTFVYYTASNTAFFHIIILVSHRRNSYLEILLNEHQFSLYLFSIFWLSYCMQGIF